MQAPLKISFVIAAALACAVASPASARADGTTLEYVTDGAAPCPTDAELRDRIVARLGSDPFVARAASADDAALAVVVRVIGTRAGTTASIEITVRGEAPGVRFISTTDGCGALIDAVATTIAVAIEDTRQTATPAQVPNGVPAPAPVPQLPVRNAEPPPAVRADDPPSPAPSTNLRGVGRAELVVLGNLLPQVAMGGGLGGGVLLPSGDASIELGAGLYAATMPDAAELAGGRRVSVSLIAVSPHACARISWFRGCVTGWIGSLDVRRIGALPATGEAFLGAIGLRAGVVVPLVDVLELVADLELVAPLVRPAIADRTLSLWAAPVAALTGSIGLGVVL